MTKPLLNGLKEVECASDRPYYTNLHFIHRFCDIEELTLITSLDLSNEFWAPTGLIWFFVPNKLVYLDFIIDNDTFV